MTALKIVCLVVGSYLLGNVNTALLISRMKKQDVRKMGSGNPGTMNMLRNFGVGMGALTLVLDVIKGALPCLFGWLMLGESWRFGADKIGAYIGGLSVIVGHVFPVFLKFKGGKGIAASIGVCLIVNPIATLVSFAVGFVFLVLTKLGSITSFIIISVPLALEGYRVAALGGGVASAVLLFCIFALTLFAHRKNVYKLFIGKESRTVIFGRHKSEKEGQKTP